MCFEKLKEIRKITGMIFVIAFDYKEISGQNYKICVNLTALLASN